MADIFIVTAGVRGLIKPEWIRPGACIVDVGVDREGTRSTKKQGRRWPSRGGVSFDAAVEIAGFIRPVPRGVGPLTASMLLKNTVNPSRTVWGLPKPTTGGPNHRARPPGIPIG